MEEEEDRPHKAQGHLPAVAEVAEVAMVEAAEEEVEAGEGHSHHPDVHPLRHLLNQLKSF